MNEMGPSPAPTDQEPPTVGRHWRATGRVHPSWPRQRLANGLRNRRPFWGWTIARPTRRSGRWVISPPRRRSCGWCRWRSSSVRLGAGISLALLDMIGFFTNLFYFQRLSVHLVSPDGQHPRRSGRRHPDRRRSDRRADGPLRLRADPWPRHPRGDGADPDQRQQGPAPPGHPEADLQRHQHRHRRAVRCRRADHPDRRGGRLDRRSALPPHRRPAPEPCWWPGPRPG